MRCRLLLLMFAVYISQSVHLSVTWLKSAAVHAVYVVCRMHGVIWCSLGQIALTTCFIIHFMLSVLVQSIYERLVSGVTSYCASRQIWCKTLQTHTFSAHATLTRQPFCTDVVVMQIWRHLKAPTVVWALWLRLPTVLTTCVEWTQPGIHGCRPHRLCLDFLWSPCTISQTGCFQLCKSFGIWLVLHEIVDLMGEPKC